MTEDPEIDMIVLDRFPREINMKIKVKGIEDMKIMTKNSEKKIGIEETIMMIDKRESKTIKEKNTMTDQERKISLKEKNTMTDQERRISLKEKNTRTDQERRISLKEIKINKEKTNRTGTSANKGLEEMIMTIGNRKDQNMITKKNKRVETKLALKEKKNLSLKKWKSKVIIGMNTMKDLGGKKYMLGKMITDLTIAEKRKKRKIVGTGMMKTSTKMIQSAAIQVTEITKEKGTKSRVVKIKTTKELNKF